MGTPLYTLQGDQFVPGDGAASPWSSGMQHGGPATGLLARVIEERYAVDGLRPARLSVDLFRAVPMKPLRASTRVLREGRRIRVVEATLLAESTEVARATALLLSASQAPSSPPATNDSAPPLGPEGLEAGSLIPESVRGDVGPGFHQEIEVRWATRPGDKRPAGWLRIPMPLVRGEELTPFQRAAALSDLGNALAGLAARRERGTYSPFINADNNLYLTRMPQGEWLGLQLHLREEHEGIGIVATVLYDERGRVGRSVSTRLVNVPGESS